MELIYPFILYISIPIIIFLLIIKINKKSIYKNGKKVANTQYTKSIPYYNEIMKKYKVLKYAVQGICILCIFLSFLLLARPSKVDINNASMYTRDISLCMDISASGDELNKGLVKNLKETVKSLKGERFGISIFNTSSVVLVPLTDDYDYVIEVLDTLEKSLDRSTSTSSSSEYLYLADYIESGTLIDVETRGSSLIGDGLASCVYTFSNLEEDRTRIIIFSTDNDLAGNSIVTLEEAGQISKNKNITVFGITPDFISNEDKIELKDAVENTGGKLYTSDSKTTVSDIVKNIEQTGKSLIKNKKEIRKIDKPEIPFILLVLSITILFVLNKRVKL